MTKPSSTDRQPEQTFSSYFWSARDSLISGSKWVFREVSNRPLQTAATVGTGAVLIGVFGIDTVVNGIAQTILPVIQTGLQTVAVIGTLGGASYVVYRSKGDEIKEAIMGQPSQELIPLQSSLQNFLDAPETINQENVRTLYNQLTPLTNNNSALLKKLAPEIFSPEYVDQLIVCNSTFKLIKEIAESDELDKTNELLNALRTENNIKLINDFFTFLNYQMGNQKGYVYQLIDTSLEGAPLLLTESRSEMNELQKAISSVDKTSIEAASKKLVPLLGELTKKRLTIFTKEPLKQEDLQFFTILAQNLPQFYGDNPPNIDEMTQVVNRGLITLNTYYDKHAGPIEKATNVIEKKLLEKVENVQKCVDNKILEVKTTVSDYLGIPINPQQALNNTAVQSPNSTGGPVPTQNNSGGPQGSNNTGGPQQAVNNTAVQGLNSTGGPVPTQNNSGGPQIPSNQGAQNGAQHPPSRTFFGDLLSRGQGILGSIMGSARSAISENATTHLAALTHWTFEQCRDYVQRNGANPILLNAINPMITRLKNAKETNSWDELKRVLDDAFTFMQQNQIYFQGMRLPINPVRTHASAIPDFLNNVTAHRNALQNPTQRAPALVTSAMIETTANLLKIRSASIGPAKFVAEKICGFDNSPQFYADIFRPSADPTAGDMGALFRTRLFEKIDASPRSFLTKWFAKRAYDFLHPLSTFYIHSIVGGILEKTLNWMKAPAGAGEQPKDEFLIKIIRNWMAVTGSALNQVAFAPHQLGRDFDPMVEEALKLPERNGGLTQQELFAAAIKTALDTFGPQIRWSEGINNYFTREIPPTSVVSFLNPGVRALNTVCSYCLKAVVFIPQWIGNKALQGGAKLVLSHTSLLKDYSDQTIDSLRRNTPSSYAMQRMIFRQQQKILALLQQSLNEDPASTGALINRNSSIKKVEIEALVKSGIELLNKSQYGTQDSLRNYLNRQAPLVDRAMQELENTFLPKAMESAVSTISIAIQAMTTEDEMQQMLYDGLQIANDAFDNPQPVSDEEFAAIEKGIRELTDQILETAIFHALDEAFDFTNERQRNGVSQYFKALKDQTGAFSTEAGQKAREIASGSCVSLTDLQAKISRLIEISAKYNKDRVDALGMADGNRNFHAETKYKLNDRSRELLSHCTPLSNRLNTMKSLSDEMRYRDKCLQPLLECNQIQRSLKEKLGINSLSNDAFNACKVQLGLLEKHLATLRQAQAPAQLISDIELQCQAFTNAMNAVQPLQKANGILRQAQVLFDRLKQVKLAEIGLSPSQELKKREMELCLLLDTLPFSDQTAQMKGRVLSFMLTTNAGSANLEADGFHLCDLEISARNFAQMNNHLAGLETARGLLEQKLELSITEFTESYAQKKALIERHAADSIPEINSIDQWAKDQIEFQIIDVPGFDMDWLTDTVKNVAFDQAKAKIKLLFDALYKRYNYVGLINQAALLPFVENFGKHYLKK